VSNSFFADASGHVLASDPNNDLKDAELASDDGVMSRNTATARFISIALPNANIAAVGSILVDFLYLAITD
jgi:hypothetical protein